MNNLGKRLHLVREERNSAKDTDKHRTRDYSWQQCRKTVWNGAASEKVAGILKCNSEREHHQHWKYTGNGKAQWLMLDQRELRKDTLKSKLHQ